MRPRQLNNIRQWQTRQVKEDLDKVMGKAAKQWDKWCKDYAKYPERAMKEKGHSRTSQVLRKLHIKKDTSVGSQQPKPEPGAVENGTAPGSAPNRQAKILGMLRAKKEALFGGGKRQSPRLTV